MTQIRYQTPKAVRKRSQNVSNQVYDDTEINEIIERYSILCHQILGTSTSTKYTSADSVYEVIKGVVLYGAAWEILSSLDDMVEETKQAKHQHDYFLRMLSEHGGSGVQVVKRGFGLNNGLDSNQYSNVDLV